MNILRAAHLGMCFGVRDAITLAQREAASGPITVLGDLVHNEIVLSRLREQGVRIERELEAVHTPTVLITAHGASERRTSEVLQRGHRLVEATCPLVRFAHDRVADLVREGFHPVIIGQRLHVEVRGLTEDLDAFDVILEDQDVYLCFLDNDTVVGPATIRLLAECLNSHADVAVACGKAYTASPSTTIMSVGMTVNLYTGVVTDTGTGEADTGQYESPGYVAACGGFCFMVKHDVFRDCNGLDNSFNPYGFEDVDFCLRVRDKGYRCFYVPQAILYHKGCKIGRGFVLHYEKYKVKHLLLLLRRHATFVQKLTSAVLIPSRALLAILRLLAHGEFRVVAAQFRGAFESVVNRS
jgi:GT2 family glycosyltransferase